jgi:hypothetical protein
MRRWCTIFIFSSVASFLWAESYSAILQSLGDDHFLLQDAIQARQKTSIKDFLQKVSQKNLPIKIAEYDRWIYEDVYHVGLDDLWLNNIATSVSTSLDWSRGPVVIGYDTPYYKSKNHSASLGMSGKTDWGVSYGVNLFRFSEAHPSEGASAASLAVGANANIALLKGAGYFVGGLREKEIELNWKVAQENMRQTTFAVLFDAEISYYESLKKYLLNALYKRYVLLSQALLDEAKRRSASEIMALEWETSLARKHQIEYQHQYEQSLDDIRNFLEDDIFLQPELDILSSLNELMPDKNVEKTVAQALEKRVDYQLLLIAAEKYKIRRKTTETAALPSLNFGAQFTRDKNVNDRFSLAAGFFENSSFQSNYSLTFTYDFLSRENSRANRALVYEDKKIEASLLNLKKEIEHDIKTVLAEMTTLHQKIPLVRHIAEVAIKKLHYDYGRYKASKLRIEDLVLAQHHALEARKEQILTSLNLNLAGVRLRKISGEAPLII